jgi:uncharacterized protein (DUF302 family)
MRLWHAAVLVLGIVTPASVALGIPASKTASGMANVPSRYSVAQTMDRLQSLATEQGLTVFARPDFSREAEDAGLRMRPSQLLIFGSPKAGTPLMVASPTVAIDLPLKALAWEDADGKVWLSYNTPEYLQRRHGVPDQLLKNVSGIKALVEKAATE